MTRKNGTRGTVVVLLACVLGVLLVFLAGAGAGVWFIVQEANFTKDKARIDQIDREISNEFLYISDTDKSYRNRVDRLIVEQNQLVRKWQTRLPNRVCQMTLEEAEKKYPRN